ncbi:MAG: hypothetical protein ACTSRP_23325 [Candidatus Helarchaeota archaeon]
METILLKRKLENIEKYLVKAEINIEEEAKIWQTITLLALEHDSKLTIDILCEKFGFTKPMAELAIKRSVDMGIIERVEVGWSIIPVEPSWKLTEEGKKVAESGKIYYPESGIYQVFISRDPLVSQKFITFLRYDERDKNKDVELKNEKTSEEVFGNIKGWEFENLLTKTNNDSNRETIIQSKYIKIIDIEKIIYPYQKEDFKNEIDLVIKLEIDQFNRNILIIGSILDNKIKNEWIKIADNFPEYYEVIYYLLKSVNVEKNWNGEKNRLLISFDETSLRERKTFRKEITIENPEIEGFGRFDPITISVPIIPKTEDDCLKWEKSLLRDRILNYSAPCNENDYNRFIDEIYRQMEENNAEPVELPDISVYIEELLEECKDQNGEYGKRPTEYWYLKAPIDLKQLELIEHGE